jgi:hypothetical protein
VNRSNERRYQREVRFVPPVLSFNLEAEESRQIEDHMTAHRTQYSEFVSEKKEFASKLI